MVSNQTLRCRMKLAARQGDCEATLKNYLALIVDSMDNNPTFIEKATPRNVIEIVEAIAALQKLKNTLGVEQDEADDLSAFKNRLTLVANNIKKKK